MHDGDSILVIWFKLICLAGSINDNGFVYLTKDIPYTEEMLATQFNRPLKTVRLALKTFEQFGMIETVDNFLHLPSWERYQNTEKLDKIREQARIRKQRQRECEKALQKENVTDVTQGVTRDVTQCHATDIDIEEDKDKDIDRDIEERESKRETADEPPATPNPSVPYESIKNLYNSICQSFSRCTTLSAARKKTIRARFVSGYTESDFEKLFRKAEASSFLKGRNKRNWTASFDWLIKDANMAKVLDGNYDDRNMGGSGPGPQDYGDPMDFFKD